MAFADKLSSAILPLGVVALVAGCGGGGAMSSGTGGTGYVPLPAAPANYSGKATLSFNIPVRKKGSSGQRQPRYISPGTSRIDVTVVPAGAASPWPNPVSTTVPSPAPSASSIPVTMTVAAPLGNAQFAVNTYDANGYLLSGVTSTPVPITSNAASNNIALTLNASAQCVQINHVQVLATSSPDLIAHPLENQNVAQSSTFVVTPCDVDGYPIPAGQQLANSLVLNETYPGPALSNTRKPRAQGPSPSPSPTATPFITFSPNVITQGGDTTVIMTYPANSHQYRTAYVAPSPGAPALWGTIKADPVFYVLSADAGSNAIVGYEDDVAGIFTTPVPIPQISVGGAPSRVVAGSPMSGCSNGGEALVTSASSGVAYALGIAMPTLAAPSPYPAVTGTFVGLSNGTSAEALDSSCNAFVGDALGDVSEFIHPFGTLTTLNTGLGNNPPDAVTSFGILSGVGQAYAGLGDNQGVTSPLTTIPSGNQVNAFQTVDAITPFDATHLAIAYHQGGALYFSLWDGTTATSPVPIASAPPTINAMASDGYNVYAISNSAIYQYVPAMTSAGPLSIPSPPPSLTPQSMVYSPTNGYYYIVDGTRNVIQRWTFSSGSAYLLEEYPGGKTALSGIAVFP